MPHLAHVRTSLSDQRRFGWVSSLGHPWGTLATVRGLRDSPQQAIGSSPIAGSTIPLVDAASVGTLE